MTLEGKDEIELQDSIDRVNIITTKYYNGDLDTEETYTKIKEQVTE